VFPTLHIIYRLARQKISYAEKSAQEKNNFYRYDFLNKDLTFEIKININSAAIPV
jgi:hypothetical protein